MLGGIFCSSLTQSVQDTSAFLAVYWLDFSCNDENELFIGFKCVFKAVQYVEDDILTKNSDTYSTLRIWGLIIEEGEGVGNWSVNHSF